ncbi:MAG TPA: hypothetical protein VIS95_00960 [Solirubrobacterales bacterium]
MGVVAHIGGVPVEEAALGLAPVVTVLASMVLVHFRNGIRRRRMVGR